MEGQYVSSDVAGQKGVSRIRATWEGTDEGIKALFEDRFFQEEKLYPGNDARFDTGIDELPIQLTQSQRSQSRASLNRRCSMAALPPHQRAQQRHRWSWLPAQSAAHEFWSHSSHFR